MGGLDFGYNNPTAGVFLARDPDGVYYWYAEHYRREAPLESHARELQAAGGSRFTWYGDPSAKLQMQELRRHGLSVVPGDHDVRAGIDTVYSLIASGRLKVFRTCKFGLDELEGYVWAKTDSGFKDEVVKESDHLMDALRYALSSGPHHQDSGEAKIRESTAGVSRKPSSDCKACGCSSKHLCGLTAWNT